MKIFIVALLGIMIVVIGTQVKLFKDRKAEALKSYESLQEKLSRAKADQTKLEEEIQYIGF